MIAYFDSSAFVKLVVPEAGSKEARALYRSATHVFSSRLLIPESGSAIGRARRTGRLDATASTAAFAELRMLLDGIVPLEVTRLVADDACRIAVEKSLRAYDAVHLASYLRMSSPTSVLVAADGDLVRAALELDQAVAVPD